MKRFLNQVWQEDDGVLSFEWVLLLTLLVIGIVGGIAAARDAIIDELADLAQAAVALDQSYTLEGIDLDEFAIPDQGFTDTPSEVVTCERGGPEGQPQLEDENG
jgi:Flp pilus assembly pilin Flp